MADRVIIKAVAKAPGSGRGAHKVRGTAEQRRQFYESFRAHTDEVREVLLSILRDDEADNGHRIQAGKEILNRGWGAAPQVNIVEAALQHHVTLNTDALKQLPKDELARLESTLVRLIEVPDAEVIEATANESAEHAPQRAQDGRLRSGHPEGT
jgi:hypothetical protein